jgi:hypothetical protein
MVKKLGRPPLGDHRVIQFAPTQDRVQPPSDLKPAELAVFRDVLRSAPHAQFSASDRYLLASFARVKLLVDQAMRDLDKAKPKDRPQPMKMLEQALKLQISLATKLRLTTSSRRERSRTHLSHRMPSFYETMDEDDDAADAADQVVDDLRERASVGNHDKPA